MSAGPKITLNHHAKDLSLWSNYEKSVLYGEIARRLLERHGPKRIAFDLSITINTLRKILKNDKFRKLYHDMERRINEPIEAAMRDERMQIQDRMNHGSQRVLTKLFDALDKATKPRDVAIIANSVLDRNPDTARVRRVQSVGMDTIRLDDDTARLLGNAMTAAARRGHAIEDVEAKVLNSPQLPETTE